MLQERTILIPMGKGAVTFNEDGTQTITCNELMEFDGFALSRQELIQLLTEARHYANMTVHDFLTKKKLVKFK
jgi:hypothetical protein